MTYTENQIASLPAAREIDCLIAENIMGYTKVHAEKHYTCMCNGGWLKEDLYGTIGLLRELIPYYSTDVSAAWQIVEHFQGEPYEYFMELSKTPSIPYKNGTAHWHIELGAKHSFADTAPLAICRVALLVEL